MVVLDHFLKLRLKWCLGAFGAPGKLPKIWCFVPDIWWAQPTIVPKLDQTLNKILNYQNWIYSKMSSIPIMKWKNIAMKATSGWGWYLKWSLTFRQIWCSWSLYKKMRVRARVKYNEFSSWTYIFVLLCEKARALSKLCYTIIKELFLWKSSKFTIQDQSQFF